MRLLFTIGLTISTLTASAAEPAGRALASTCPGKVYVTYAFPAFGSCPCGEGGCFHPRPYYACRGDGDPAYKKAFWRRWLRAHFRGGSMLDGVPCHCVFPPRAGGHDNGCTDPCGRSAAAGGGGLGAAQRARGPNIEGVRAAPGVVRLT